jgi:hypothetical protein
MLLGVLDVVLRRLVEIAPKNGYSICDTVGPRLLLRLY